MNKNAKLLTRILQISTLALTITLAWFAFVFYPKIINNYKVRSATDSRVIVKPVEASSYDFPIETTAYKIIYEQGSNSYYVFVAGDNYDEYVMNRTSAKLALKTALSTLNLCNYNVFYSPQKNLNIPKVLLDDPNYCN